VEVEMIVRFTLVFHSRTKDVDSVHVGLLGLGRFNAFNLQVGAGS
jgi:hypothetical protein